MNINVISPATHALLVPEILENIFSHLSKDEDLFKIITVNHIWRSEGFRAICNLYAFRLNNWVSHFNNTLSAWYKGKILKSCLNDVISCVYKDFVSLSMTYNKYFAQDRNMIFFFSREMLGDLINEYIYFQGDIENAMIDTSNYNYCYDIHVYDNEEEVSYSDNGEEISYSNNAITFDN
ncbi:10947_t:CDS:1 [Entrophospora sp. SA101]|nr:10947_t:CDS:1 [Entrophospora sp. SA101]